MTLAFWSLPQLSTVGQRKLLPVTKSRKGILEIGLNKCARDSGFDRKNFIRKLVRGVAVKRNSYDEFVRWLVSPLFPAKRRSKHYGRATRSGL